MTPFEKQPILLPPTTFVGGSCPRPLFSSRKQKTVCVETVRFLPSMFQLRDRFSIGSSTSKQCFCFSIVGMVPRLELNHERD